MINTGKRILNDRRGQLMLLNFKPYLLLAYSNQKSKKVHHLIRNLKQSKQGSNKSWKKSLLQALEKGVKVCLTIAFRYIRLFIITASLKKHIY